ncbi:MAG: cytochrome c3 family protein [Desulfobacterales bacterium]|nr:cytochrome c3 family protein [Desulfobacterales bacterium]
MDSEQKGCLLKTLGFLSLIFVLTVLGRSLSVNKPSVELAGQKKQSSAETPAVSTLKTGISTYVPTSGTTDLKDVIRLENKAYKKHTKEIVVFEHRKHSKEYVEKYPKLHASACGECHHDDKAIKQANLKENDRVQNCIECHKKLGEIPQAEKKALKQQKLSKNEYEKKILEYQGEALHMNCIDCHKIYKRQTKKKNAPATCVTCHAQPKKK